MSDPNKTKKYEASKIPGRGSAGGTGNAASISQAGSLSPASQEESVYYEIDYDSSPIPGVGKFVLKPQKIKPPENDEIRELFLRMRQIARQERTLFFSGSRFYDQKIRRENSKIFYKQGVFMKDFTDSYPEAVPYSSYFPNYQIMGYEQLRTYFTWRTAVRGGTVPETSLSYAFLYIYELLNNIGVDSPLDGLERLTAFWRAFRVYDETMDKYLLQWFKDYHICYELPHSFKEFIDKNGLAAHYPGIADPEKSFDLFCSISKYDIRKSAFYKENTDLVTDCFSHVLKTLQTAFSDRGLKFDDTFFHPAKKMSPWSPFQNALFYPKKDQPERRVTLSSNETYLYRDNQWMFSKVITSESGKQLAGYVLRQMEATLRKATGYRFSLTANLSTVSPVSAGVIKEAGIDLPAVVSGAVMDFYREATKIVVQVDERALSRIRQEALAVQEKLIVPEQEEPLPVKPVLPPPQPEPAVPASPPDSWGGLKAALSETELQALRAILDGEGNIRAFADEKGIMLEVLMDEINSKAMDFIGDNLMDETFLLYEDYSNQVRELVE